MAEEKPKKRILSTDASASSPMSRRRFLHTTATVGAGLTLGAQAASGQAQDGATPTKGRSSDALFVIAFDAGAITSLKRAQDRFDTDYIRSGQRLGDVTLRYRRPGGDWQTFQTAQQGAPRTAALSEGDTVYTVTYPVTEGERTVLTLRIRFILETSALRWEIAVKNATEQPLEIGDLALPLPMNTSFQRGKPATASVLKHSFVSGHGSFLFWMRPNSVGPYLMLTPTADTPLEYWEAQGGYRVFIHSAAAKEEATKQGSRWRQPHTALSLTPQGRAGEEQSYGFRFDWVEDYAAARQLLVKNGQVDVTVVPGMTVPSGLLARFALRTTQKIQAIEAEFPKETTIKALGAKGDSQIYEVRFARLGENRLTVRYGKGKHLFLEFFATEPVETLIKKRGAFIARHQERDASKWYNGLLCEWNMESQVRLSPDNYDRIQGWRIYEVTCDDPGLSKPAYLAAKNAEYPVQGEVEALDYYIKHFVWGGLQCTTEEPYPYGIYGIPDWKQNRNSSDPGRNGKRHLWRIYDYPHIFLMYFGMYRIAKFHPQIKTALPAKEYLQRACGTAVAMFTLPFEIEKWSAYQTGLYNELVIVDLIDALETEGMADDAARVREHWEKKVSFFVNDKPDLFGSEYPFDSTGFESTHALAKYALERAGADGGRVPARRFLETQMAANIFCRGWLEPAYYLLGSDYRASAGNAYTLSYMSQMGGWSILDYALYHAADPYPYLRLGYASYLSSWALMNTGTPETQYGYWYSGKENDGGAGGGFEPAPYGTTWLGQPHHRGSWYYSCEIDLGYCGALRAAMTVLADDPLFGRFCYGGDWRKTRAGIEVIPRDGVRRRFHALIGSARLHLVSETDRFSATNPIVVREDLSEVRFSLESENPAQHTATLRLSGMAFGIYTVRSNKKMVATVELKDGQETVIPLPMEVGTAAQTFTIARQRIG